MYDASMIADSMPFIRTGPGGVFKTRLTQGLPTEIRSEVRVWGERGQDGEGGNMMWKERGSGASVMGRWEAVTADVECE